MKPEHPPDPDLLIVGAGAAGLAAAARSAELGLRCTVLEAGPAAGGSAILSGGGICVAGTDLQRVLGIIDTPELALTDWLSVGDPMAVDVAWARAYLKRAVSDLYDWLARLGVEWRGILPQEGNAVPRWHYPRGDGAEIVSRLAAAAKAGGWALHTGTHVDGLLSDERGRVVGVEATSPGGVTRFSAHATLVTTGGFAGNRAALENFAPHLPPHVLLGSPRTVDGSGHTLLADVGAAFAPMDRIWTYPYGIRDHEDPRGDAGIAVRGLRNDIWLNSDGHRFLNEQHRGAGTATPLLMQQPGGFCWSVFDSEELSALTLSHPRFGTIDEPERERIANFIAHTDDAHHGATIEDLALATGLPRDALEDAIATYNSGVLARLRSERPWGRDLSFARPMAHESLWAVRLSPLARKCLGGVLTDLHGRVLDHTGNIVRGLYAAGEVAGMAGGHINGIAALEGTMLGPSLLSGRVVAETVVKARPPS